MDEEEVRLVTDELTGTARDGVGVDPWTMFGTRLAAYMSTMIDPSDADRLVLRVPRRDDGGSEPVEVVIEACAGGSGLRVHYPFDSTGCDVGDAADMGPRIGNTIQLRYGTPDPSLLTAHASGPAAIGLGILGLADANEVGDDQVRDLIQETSNPEDPGQLRDMVLDHVRAVIDAEAEVDGDGDVRFEYQGVTAYYGIVSDEPAIRLFAPIVLGVRSPQQADTELNVLNRRHIWTGWVRHGDRVIQETTIPGSPLNPHTLYGVTAAFVADFRDVVHDLADRVGGAAVGG